MSGMSEPTPFATQKPRNKRLLQNHDTLAQWVQHILNLSVVSATLCAFAYWRDGEIGQQYRTMLAFAILLMTITYHIMGVFRRFDRLEGAIQHLARAWGVVIIILAWTAFLTRTSEEYSRQVVVYWVLTAFFGQALLLTLTYSWFKLYRRKYQQRLPAIVLGTGNLAKHLAMSINNNIWLNDSIIGVVRHRSESGIWGIEGIPVLGCDTELEQLIKEHKVRRVYIALPLALTYDVKTVHDILFDDNLDLVWAPDIFDLQLLNHSVREVAGVPLINLSETPLMAGGPAFIKLLMDKSISLVLIILLSPVFAILALAVRLSSPGPIIFKQERDGWDGKKFYVYKFRSMYVHKEGEIIEQAKKDDRRITPVGRIIRRTSLDELPQLFNALEGSMSLVGPRPHAVSHNIYYSDKVKAYLARHRIKPGITGLAQISGFRGETQELEHMQKRVELDLEYISNWSPLLDLKILFLTPFRLISKRGNAY
jgi:putative colanic acid biosynthesis UDP-glucose lipid carrier transferase